MKITAIIAEYNPFHNGHLKQLRAAKRETGADAVVVVMSGSFTQHGDIAIVDKYTRASWALEAGADMVLELPTAYSLSTASGFAEGALKTLSMLGEYTLSFGTEADELSDLNMAAEFMRSESKDMSNLLKGYLNEGYSLAKSRTMALDLLRPDVSNMLKSPNNILAVEYIKASAKYGDKIHLHSVFRKEDDGKKYLSSSKIRALLEDGKDASPFVPPFVDLENRVKTFKYATVAAYAIKSMSSEQLGKLANVSEGMENRLANADFNNFNEVLQLTSKRYTRSTIKRIAASASVGLTKELARLAEEEKPYCTVLAIRPSKKKLLLPLLASSDGYYFFKSSDCDPSCPVFPLVKLDEKAAKIQKICL